MAGVSEEDQPLIEIFLAPLRKCANYRPAFGSEDAGDGLDLGGFMSLYGADPFYAWVGLADPLVYAAHKAAGGLTSVYRQLGVGCERLFRAILNRELGLSPEQMTWSYSYAKGSDTTALHTLDARLSLADLKGDAQRRLRAWMEAAQGSVTVPGRGKAVVDGVVFEVRQGYKSADSKRQNADLRFGVNAYRERLLPAFAILSSQVSAPVIKRYRADGMLVLTGTPSKDPTTSTFAFFKDVIGYDLPAFFERNSPMLHAETKAIIDKLLKP